jgi:hypothetical protein
MSVGLTRTDLSDHENRRDCVEDFRRARDGLGGTLRMWARKWGQAIITELGEPSQDEDATEYHENIAKAPLQAAIEQAVADLEPIADAMDEKAAAPLEKIIAALEKAIEE